jgi:hypothetical protein
VVARCYEAAAYLPSTQVELMVASLARERSGLTAVRQQLEAGMVTLRVVAVLVVEGQNQ